MKNPFDLTIHKIDEVNIEVANWVFSLIDEQEQADELGMNIVEYFEHNARVFAAAAQWLAETLPPEDGIEG